MEGRERERLRRRWRETGGVRRRSRSSSGSTVRLRRIALLATVVGAALPSTTAFVQPTPSGASAAAALSKRGAAAASAAGSLGSSSTSVGLGVDGDSRLGCLGRKTVGALQMADLRGYENGEKGFENGRRVENEGDAAEEAATPSPSSSLSANRASYGANDAEEMDVEAELELERDLNRKTALLEKRLYWSSKGQDFHTALKAQKELYTLQEQDGFSVLQMNRDFYDAISTGDNNLMKTLWMDSHKVQMVHEKAKPVSGYKEVLEGWQKQMALMTRNRQSVRPRDIKVNVSGTGAMVTCVEESMPEARRRLLDKTPGGSSGDDASLGNFPRALNVFEKKNGRWWLVHHHSTGQVPGCKTMPQTSAGGGSGISLGGNNLADLLAGAAEGRPTVIRLANPAEAMSLLGGNQRLNSGEDDDSDSDDDSDDEGDGGISARVLEELQEVQMVVEEVEDDEEEDDDDDDEDEEDSEDSDYADSDSDSDEDEDDFGMTMNNSRIAGLSRGPGGVLTMRAVDSLRRLEMETRITKEEKRRLLTSVIEHATSDEPSPVEMAYELLMGGAKDGDAWSDFEATEDYVEQCKAFALQLRNKGKGKS